ncbi:MAG: class I SAM-dependent methyltransferase [Bacilli bacterium]|jgi:demethylmenaquinone methyltransferase/2-methoxy-6-polyprenyl-1,4-benzoquinol methylase|nr:class I SAM-dependent methyltransferase [Bacilli bacterium]
MNEVRDFFDRAAPTWDSDEKMGRDDLLALLRRLRIKEGDKVLDIACGTGIITPLLAALSKRPVLGVDLSEGMIAEARKKFAGNPSVSFRCLDFVSVPLDEKFDYAVIYDAYPHFMDPKALSRALSAALNPGGRFAIVHSMSTRALNEHHRGVPSGVSRQLGPVAEEAANFAGDFAIETALDEANSIFIIGRKRP